MESFGVWGGLVRQVGILFG